MAPRWQNGLRCGNERCRFKDKGKDDGERCRVTQLPATWLRVGLGDGPDGLVTLSAAGRELAVGRHLVPAHRRQLAAELRAALHAALR